MNDFFFIGVGGIGILVVFLYGIILQRLMVRFFVDYGNNS